MKRAFKAWIIGILALLCAATGAVTAWAQEQADPQPVRTESRELFLPSSAEQFLPLNAPNDTAVGKDYIAVADGSTIYVYDRKEARYSRFTGEAGITYSSLCFYEDYLFFVPSGSETYITYFDCSAMPDEGIGIEDTAQLRSSEGTSITCSSFILNGNLLYYATITSSNVAVFSRELDPVTLTVGTRGSDLAPANSSNTAPYFTVYNGQTYYSLPTDNGDIYSIEAGRSIERYDTYFTVYSFAIADGRCFYSSADNNHYFYAASGEPGDEQIYADGKPVQNVTAVETYGDRLYLVTGASVKEYDADAGDYTGYEITQYSSGKSRLGQGASSLSLYGNNLAIADPSNARVLLYDTADDRYASVAVTDLGSAFSVCAGAENFLVTNGSVVRLFTYEGAALSGVPQDDVFDGIVRDCAYSYGAYYLVTNTGATYRLTAAGDMQNGQLPSAPTAIAADIGGGIWAFSAASNTAYRYTEENFLSQNANYEADTVSLGAGVTDILVDYAGNVYGLTADGVYRHGAQLYRTFDAAEHVYYADAADAVAFAFGFTSGDAYILTDAGIVLRWSYGIESLDNIPADGIYAALTGSAGAQPRQDLLVTVEENAVVVPLEESGCTESMTVLPATGYALAGGTRTGVKVADVPDPDGEKIGTVVALYEFVPGTEGEGQTPTQRNYTLCLILEEGTQALPQREYYTEADGRTGYTSNSVGLYNLPLMRTGNTATRTELAKNTPVTVLGTLHAPAPQEGGWGLDADYCFVSCTVGGAQVYGYVPAAYINESASTGEVGTGGETLTYRHLKAGESVTLGRADGSGEGGAADSIDLADGELLTVHGEADENGLVLVSYERDGVLYTGRIEESKLERASTFGIWIIVAVTIVTIAVLISTCYLILRKTAPPQSAAARKEDAAQDPEDDTP